MKAAVVVGCLSLVALLEPSAFAAEADGEAAETIRLTEAEAIARAVGGAPRLERLRALKRAAEAESRGAKAGRLPMIGIAGGYTRNSNVPELTLVLPPGERRTLFPNIPDNYRAHAEASWALYTGGRSTASIEAAQDEQVAAEGDLEAERQELILDLRRTYWALVTAREMNRVLDEALAAFEAHLKAARDREKVGLAARNEVLSVEVERDRAELAKLRAENAAQVVEANLLRLADLPATAQVEVIEPLVAPLAPAAEGEVPLAEALSARPELSALRARLSAAEARVRVEQAARLPQLVMLAEYDYANPNRKILPPAAQWKQTWDVGLGVSLAVFDGGKASAAVARARARRDALAAQIEDVTRLVRLEVGQRVLDLKTARAATNVAARAVEAATENRRVAAERYQAGVLASFELLDAEVALLRAGLDRSEAWAQLRMAAAALDRAVGRGR